MFVKTKANAPVGQLKLDQTGEFLQTGCRSPDKKPRKESPQLAEWEKLFLKEAFFLYENRERILSDIRMSLTPTPFRNGLAYSGTSGPGSRPKKPPGLCCCWISTCRGSTKQPERYSGYSCRNTGISKRK